MEDYKPNSFKSKETGNTEPEKRQLEKVVTGNVKTVKKGKLSNVFAEGDIKKIVETIIVDVAVPKLKDLLSSMVKTGLDTLLWGDSNHSSSNYGSDRPSYQSYYKRPSERYTEPRSRDVYSYDDVVIPSRGEAENVLRIMRDQLSEYGLVSVHDFYSLVGIQGTHVDCKYGWTDLRTAYVDRVRDGYLVRFPKALPLD